MPEERTRSFGATYTLPAKLHREDKLVAYGPFSLTLRQAGIMTLGGWLSVEIWNGWASLQVWGTMLSDLRLVCTMLPLLMSWLIGYVRIADRPLELWVMVLLRYRSRLRCLVWQKSGDGRRMPGARDLVRQVRKKRRWQW